MNVELTACIVAYNNYDDIINAIESMNNYVSSKLSKKIYIVDNSTSGSNESVKCFKKYIESLEDFEYISSGANLGFGKAHNQVLEKINSKYHAIINPDILFCGDIFTKIVNWMDVNREVGMVIPLIVDEDGNRLDVYRKELTLFDMINRMLLKEKFKKRASEHVMKDMDYSTPFEVPFGQGSFLIIRTELFKTLKGFDEKFFMYVEDADLCKRVNQVSKLMYYPNARVIHKWQKGSHKDFKLLRYHILSSIHYFNKWGWKII